MVDPIADFLTRIRNAQMASVLEIELPYSNVKFNIANVMLKNKFLLNVEVNEEGKFKTLVLTLPEETLTLKRVSKSGQRIYKSAVDIRKVLNGLGIAIVSTSKGMMTGYEARAKGLGGEIICEVS